ncbi:MAG: hypothetical protein PHU12_01630 [Candidatus Aenigmarchaeota archaeon]|nr:hypothetical protein [Candidatus Aenigmarchaeota archaeon]
MAKKRPVIKINAGTVWFLAILVISLLAAVVESNLSSLIVWMILAICGAMVAIYNIRFEEENSFLMAVASLFIVIMAWSSAGLFTEIGSTVLVNALINLMIGLGVAGFIVAISLIFKIAIDK